MVEIKFFWIFSSRYALLLVEIMRIKVDRNGFNIDQRRMNELRWFKS